MRNVHTSLLVRLVVSALLLTALIPGHASVSAAQDADNSYTHETHDVTVTWTDAWIFNPPAEDASSIMSLDRDSSIILIIGVLEGSFLVPEEAVWLLFGDESELIEDRSNEYPPSATFTDDITGMVYTSEAHSINDGETTLLLMLATIPVLQSSALDIVHNELTVNGSQILTGQPLGEADVDATAIATGDTGRTSRTSRTDDASPVPTEETSRTGRSGDASPEATEEPDPEVSRTSRTGSEPAETAEATEEPTTEVTRTSRTGSGATETPEATEVVTPEPEPTEEPIESQTLDSFIGPVYGYTVSYDSEIWTPGEEFETESVDGIRLDGETGTAFIWGTDDYGTDPVGCLAGEDTYFSSSEDISDWQVASGADGEPLQFEGDDLAWGVFLYTYTSASGDSMAFVDYISCETIPGHDAVLIVHLTSEPETYNNNLDLVLDILDTLEFQP